METSGAVNQRGGRPSNFEIKDFKGLVVMMYNAFKEDIRGNITKYDTVESFDVFLDTYVKEKLNEIVFKGLQKQWVIQSGRNDPTDLQYIRFNSSQVVWLIVEFFAAAYRFRSRVQKYYQDKHAKVQSIEEAMQSIEDLVEEREVAEIMADMSFSHGNLLEEGGEKRQKMDDEFSFSSSMKPVTTPALTYPGNTLRAHMQHLNINLP